MPHILAICRDATFWFFDLAEVFGVGEGPFRIDDGLAPVLCGVGSVHLKCCGGENEEGGYIDVLHCWRVGWLISLV